MSLQLNGEAGDNQNLQGDFEASSHDEAEKKIPMDDIHTLINTNQRQYKQEGRFRRP